VLLGCQKIVDKYEEMGRPFTTCTLLKGSNLSDTEVVYQTTEGPKVTVRDIQFTGNTFVSSARLTAQLQSSKEWFHSIGGVYNKQLAEKNVAVLSDYFRRFGYRDVRVALETKRSDDNGSTVTMIFHIQEGKRYRGKTEDNAVGSSPIPRKQLIALSTLKYCEDESGRSDLLIHVMEKPIDKCNRVKARR
jgi:outer membrane protein assembly factor BamA